MELHTAHPVMHKRDRKSLPVFAPRNALCRDSRQCV